MITKKDLEEAIKECQSVKNPNATVCMMLASYMTIKDHLYPEHDQQFSYAIENNDIVTFQSDSNFGQAVYGKHVNDVLCVIDDLMGILEVLNPALYGSVLRQVDS